MLRIAWKSRRVQIVSEIEPQGSNRCLVTHPQANGMRHIVVVALQMRNYIEAELRVRLVPSPQALNHFLRPGEDISHIVENRKADVVVNKWHWNIGQPQFQRV